MPNEHRHVMPSHGARELPLVSVDHYNAELRDAEGFVGDRASNRAFRSILDDWRERLRQMNGEDPLGDKPTEKVDKRRLEKLIGSGDVEAAGLVLSAIEEFAQELTTVIRRLLRLKQWRDTEVIVIGGGFRGGRVGELAIGRAALLLKADGRNITLQPIRHDPDEAGLIGCVQLVPPWILSGHNAILAVDIGGTSFRAGVVALRWRKKQLSSAEVTATRRWRHRDDKPTRDEAVDKLCDMLKELIKEAEAEKLDLAPFIGVGCPGIINDDGSIERGGQNLPGNWEHRGFNLAQAIAERIPRIGDVETHLLMHNDAVVQGLSEAPFLRKISHWGVLTIGTGLGNAHFSNHAPDD